MSLRSLALVAALAVPLLAAPPAHAAAPSYVALGDSYSSGVGTRSYLDDGTSCQRSTYAYPSLVAAAQGYALNFRACSGAKIADVTTSQLGALSSATRYVTISVGGNDAGFAGVLTECALPGWMSNCDRGDQHRAGLHHQHAARARWRRSTPRSAPRRRAPAWSWSATRGSSWARTATL